MEELDEMVALEQWDGLALSQQLSEVCLYTPLHSPDLKEIVVVETSVAEQLLQPLEEVEEVNLADQEDENDHDDPHDQICSQDVFCTPDFITPIEQQFPVHFDVNKVKACYTPPPAVPNCFLSSMRASFECGFCLHTWKSCFMEECVKVWLWLFFN
jgi:hypothetical protein